MHLTNIYVYDIIGLSKAKENKIMTLQKVNKSRARKAFNANQPIWITACYMRPETGIRLNSECYADLEHDFDKIINAFQYYNCTNETGRYPAYYIET